MLQGDGHGQALLINAGHVPAGSGSSHSEIHQNQLLLKPYWSRRNKELVSELLTSACPGSKHSLSAGLGGCEQPLQDEHGSAGSWRGLAGPPGWLRSGNIAYRERWRQLAWLDVKEWRLG